MNLELKKAIFNNMLENATDFQLVNNTVERFRQYIYTPAGEYRIGGQKVADFIKLMDKKVFND